MIAQNSEVYNPPTYLFHYTRIWKKISVGGVVYFTVLCDHPCLVSLLFAVLVSLHPVTFSNVFYYFVISIKNLLSYNYYFDDHKNVVGIAIAAHYSVSVKYSCIIL